MAEKRFGVIFFLNFAKNCTSVLFDLRTGKNPFENEIELVLQTSNIGAI